MHSTSTDLAQPLAAMPEQEAASTISARGLTRSFGNHIAVNDITLELRRGEVLGFLGPNGAGKTTTMHMLTGNLAPSRGEISICGIDLLEEPVRGQGAHRLPAGSAAALPRADRRRVPRARRRSCTACRARAAATRSATVKQRCGLADVGGKLIGTLSKGYQQRVGIAQAIVHSPDVVVLDEPTVGLDPNQIREIRALIRELGGAHSVILSTHILPEVEAVCDRVQIMHHGELVYSDTIAALKQFESGATLLVGLRRPPPRRRARGVAGRGGRGRRRADAVPRPVRRRRGSDRCAGEDRRGARLGPLSAEAGADQPGGRVRPPHPP